MKIKPRPINDLDLDLEVKVGICLKEFLEKMLQAKYGRNPLNRN